MKRMLKTMMIMIFALLLFLFCGCGAIEIDPILYTDIEYDGMDGSGQAYVAFNYDMLATTILDNTDEKGLQDYILILGNLYKAIDVTCDKADQLSNGDEIKVTYIVNKELLDSLKIKLTKKSTNFVVQKLKEPIKIDAFKDVDVTFDGYSPAITATVTNNSNQEFLQYLDYTIDQTNGLSNGDTVTVTAQIPKWRADAAEYVLISESAEYTVDNLPEWVTTEAQLSVETRDQLLEQALSMVEAELASISGTALDTDLTGQNYFMKGDQRSFTHSDPCKVGETLLVHKYMDGANPNQYVIIYEIPVEITLDKTEEVVYTGNAYCAINFHSLFVTTDGITEPNLESARIHSFAAMKDELYNDLIRSLSDEYAIIDMLDK